MREFLCYGPILDRKYWPEEPGTTPNELKEFLSGGGDVLIRINSAGGSAFAGIAMYSLLKGYTAGAVTAQIEGQASSAAGIVAVAADKTRASLGSVFLCHNASTIAWGDTLTMRRVARDLSTIDEGIADILMTRFTGTREELTALMAEDRYLSRAEAIRFGFVNDETEVADVTETPSAQEQPGEEEEEAITENAARGVGAESGRNVEQENRSIFERLKNKKGV